MNFLERHISDLNNYILSDRIDRSVLTSVHAEVAHRIFTQGKDERNQQIGTYSKAYLKTRKKQKWGSSRKVILQLTRQMVNDFSLIVIGKNHYGSGFKNSANYDKSQYSEATYRKRIFALTDQEEAGIAAKYNEAIKKFSR